MSGLNPLPNDTFLDWSKLKAFADDRINVNKKLKFVLSWVYSKYGGKRRKGWLPTFSPFPTIFSKRFLYRVVKSRDCVAAKYNPFITCSGV